MGTAEIPVAVVAAPTEAFPSTSTAFCEEDLEEAAAAAAAAEAQKTQEVVEALPLLQILETLLHRHMLQLERHREPLLPRQKRQLLLLLLLHLVRVRPQLRPALLDPHVSVESKEKVLSLLLVEVLLQTGEQLQQQCSHVVQVAEATGSKCVAAAAAEGTKMGTRLLQLLHRLGSRGTAARNDPNITGARQALLQTVTHLWEQQQQLQQQPQQHQQKQAAQTLLQVVSRVESLPANLLQQLPKQLHSVRLLQQHPRLQQRPRLQRQNLLQLKQYPPSL